LKIETSEPTIIHVDNEGARSMSEQSSFSARSKHIEVQQYFIQEHVQNKTIKFNKINTLHQLADPFTKPLKPEALKRFNDVFLTDTT
jgi:hypothetical protein